VSFSDRVVSHFTGGILAMSLSAILLAPLAANATTLTGAGLMGTDGAGNTTQSYWNTLPGDGFFNLYLKDGVGFINNGEGAGTPISVNLSPGSYTFNIFADPGAGANFGLNLFFNSDANTPRISVFGPVDSASFGPNAGTARKLDGTLTPGANTDTFVDGSTTVVLTGFNIASPVAVDQVSPFNNIPNGVADFTGSFSLRVTGQSASAPEPASVMLFGGGLVILLAATRRRRRA
jgi:hypothetical protein